MGKLFDFESYNKNRHVLGETLPLDMPYTLQVFITNLCNYKCFYCIKSQPKREQNRLGVNIKSMEFDLYKKIIDNVAAAGHLKLLIFQGWGEPLLHKDICKMVKYASDKKVADNLRIITNGQLLTHEMSHGLIEAGLTDLKISLQGLSAESYKKIADIEMDYQKYVDNIAYFYRNKTNARVIVKIMDIMIKEPEARDLFFKTYENICDEMMIEALIPFSRDVDYSSGRSDFTKSWLNQDIIMSDICSQIFMRATINVDGEVIPCHNLPSPIVFGNAVTDDFKSIWNGAEHRKFMLQFLKGQKLKIPVCNECNQFVHGLIPTEILDGYRINLIEKYEAMGDL